MNPRTVAAAVVAAAPIVLVVLPGFRRWLASMRTGIRLLALVAGVSVLGVLVGQGLPADAYVARYGHAVGTFLVISGIADIFRTPYFGVLLELLALSIIVCSLGRIRRLFRAPERGLAASAGSLLSHLSIVVILAGGLLSAVTGFRYAPPIYLAAGESLTVSEGGFTVRVDAARTEFSGSGVVSEYVSDVTVLEGGRELRSERVEVNRPLVHRGIGVYQYEMLPSATSVREVVIGVLPSGAEGRTAPAEWRGPIGREIAVAGTDLSLKVLEFLGDFTYDIENRTAALKSVRHANPAVLVQVTRAGRVIGERWLFPALRGHPDDDIPYRLALLDYAPDFENGLTRFEISRQPGTHLLYAGFAALSLGLCLIFWTRVPSARGPRDEVTR